MAKQKKKNKPEEDILKHYESYEDITGKQPGSKEQACIDPGLLEQPFLKELLDKAKASEPKFVKAKIAVDRLMSERKSAVIKDPARKRGT